MRSRSGGRSGSFIRVPFGYQTQQFTNIRGAKQIYFLFPFIESAQMLIIIILPGLAAVPCRTKRQSEWKIGLTIKRGIRQGLSVPEGDSALGQVVGGQFQG